MSLSKREFIAGFLGAAVGASGYRARVVNTAEDRISQSVAAGMPRAEAERRVDNAKTVEPVFGAVAGGMVGVAAGKATEVFQNRRALLGSLLNALEPNN
jgi:hypothetical protein